jgi:hypothetical protein
MNEARVKAPASWLRSAAEAEAGERKEEGEEEEEEGEGMEGAAVERQWRRASAPRRGQSRRWRELQPRVGRGDARRFSR